MQARRAGLLPPARAASRAGEEDGSRDDPWSGLRPMSRLAASPKRIRMATGTLPPKDGLDDRTHGTCMAGRRRGRRRGQYLAQRSGRRQGQERTEEGIALAESHATYRVLSREDGRFSRVEGGIRRDRRLLLPQSRMGLG